MSPLSILLVLGFITSLSISCHEGSFGSSSVTGDDAANFELGTSDQEPANTTDQEIVVETGNGPDETGKELDKAPADDPKQNRKDRYECAKKLGSDSQKIHIAGDQNIENIAVGQGLIAKVTGNHNQLNLTISGTVTEGKLQGVCLFLAGNKAVVHLKSSIPMGQIHIIARGNRAKASLTIAEGDSVEQISWDGRGNQPSLSIQGSSQYTCPSNGFTGRLSCE